MHPSNLDRNIEAEYHSILDHIYNCRLIVASITWLIADTRGSASKVSSACLIACSKRRRLAIWNYHDTLLNP